MSKCIMWEKSLGSTGYGQTFFQGKVTKAHRAAWIKANGPIPDGMFIDHMCHNEAAKAGLCKGGLTCKHRACVNVEHLRLTNNIENMMAGIHNRDVRGVCRQGHPTTPENTMTRKDGRRECAECNRIRSRENYRKKVKA